MVAYRIRGRHRHSTETKEIEIQLTKADLFTKKAISKNYATTATFDFDQCLKDISSRL